MLIKLPPFGRVGVGFTFTPIMHLIEQNIVGKRSLQECEDGIVVSEWFAAVIDGSTSKTPVRITPDMTNGRYCMTLVSRYIAEIAADTDVTAFCKGVTAMIRSEYEAAGIDLQRLESHPEERLTASAAVYSEHLRQVWMIGDCQCMIGQTHYENAKPIEAVLAGKRSAYLTQAIKEGLTIEEIQADDPGRRHIQEDLIASCMGQNTEYSVIDGFDIPFDKIKVIDVPTDCNEIILASDGYPFLKTTVQESENALHEQLLDDPLCINTFKATKGVMRGNVSFDDRSYVKVEICLADKPRGI